MNDEVDHLMKVVGEEGILEEVTVMNTALAVEETVEVEDLVEDGGNQAQPVEGNHSLYLKYFKHIFYILFNYRDRGGDRNRPY